MCNHANISIVESLGGKKQNGTVSYQLLGAILPFITFWYINNGFTPFKTLVNIKHICANE